MVSDPGVAAPEDGTQKRIRAERRPAMDSSADKPTPPGSEPRTTDDLKSRRRPETKRRGTRCGIIETAENKTNELIDFISYIGHWNPEA